MLPCRDHNVADVMYRHYKEKVEVITTVVDHNDNMSALSAAVVSQSLDTVEELLAESSRDINVIDDNNTHPVQFQAIETDNVQLVKLLLDHGVDFTGACSLGTVLHCASRVGNVEIVDVLLDLGTLDVDDDRCQRLFTPLHVAAQLGHAAVVRRLLDSGADVNNEDEQPADEHDDEDDDDDDADDEDVTKKVAIGDRTPLHLAAIAGDVTSIRHLLSVGADRHATAAGGLTPFMLAALMSRSEAMDGLLGNCDLDEPIVGGQTNLHLCCVAGSDRGLNYLLAKGADPNKLTPSGETPLIMVLKNKHIRCAKALIQDGRCRSSINHVIGGSNGQTALFIALDNCDYDDYDDDGCDKHTPIYRDIIRLGADPNQLVTEGRFTGTLLMHYFMAYDDIIARYLLEHGANPNIVTKDGCALSAALTTCCTEAIELLLEFNVDVRTAMAPINTEGGTFMSNAMTSANVRLVISMITWGFDVTNMLQIMERYENIPLELIAGSAPVVKYISAVGCTPPSLRELSRLRVLPCLPFVNIGSCIDSLEIPDQLRDYLKIENFAKLKENEMKNVCKE